MSTAQAGFVAEVMGAMLGSGGGGLTADAARRWERTGGGPILDFVKSEARRCASEVKQAAKTDERMVEQAVLEAMGGANAHLFHVFPKFVA